MGAAMILSKLSKLIPSCVRFPLSSSPRPTWIRRNRHWAWSWARHGLSCARSSHKRCWLPLQPAYPNNALAMTMAMNLIVDDYPTNLDLGRDLADHLPGLPAADLHAFGTLLVHNQATFWGMVRIGPDPPTASPKLGEGE